MTKEFLYVGHYYDSDNNYILKIGTTNNLARRRREHNRTYSQSDYYTLKKGTSFDYDWFLPLSKYNTLRYEDSNRTRWQDMEIGEYVRNDRFVCLTKPTSVTIKIRKEYEVLLS